MNQCHHLVSNMSERVNQCHHSVSNMSEKMSYYLLLSIMSDKERNLCLILTMNKKIIILIMAEEIILCTITIPLSSMADMTIKERILLIMWTTIEELIDKMKEIAILLLFLIGKAIADPEILLHTRRDVKIILFLLTI
jgi:hypothetical protein